MDLRANSDYFPLHLSDREKKCVAGFVITFIIIIIIIIIIIREITKFTNLEVSRHCPLVLRVKPG